MENINTGLCRQVLSVEQKRLVKAADPSTLTLLSLIG